MTQARTLEEAWVDAAAPEPFLWTSSHTLSFGVFSHLHFVHLFSHAFIHLFLLSIIYLMFAFRINGLLYITLSDIRLQISSQIPRFIEFLKHPS